jgi:hypothetical protein
MPSTLTVNRLLLEKVQALLGKIWRNDALWSLEEAQELEEAVTGVLAEKPLSAQEKELRDLEFLNSAAYLTDTPPLNPAPPSKTIGWLEQLELNEAANGKCWCTTCRPITLEDMRFVVCPECGNKRCPKAHNHALACTNSNAVGQPGSSWENIKPFQPEEVPGTGQDPTGPVPD